VKRKLDVRCGCFGNGEARRVGWVKLLENFATLAVTAVAALAPERNERRVATTRRDVLDSESLQHFSRAE
jgi:hypothetical protein